MPAACDPSHRERLESGRGVRQHARRLLLHTEPASAFATACAVSPRQGDSGVAEAAGRAGALERRQPYYRLRALRDSLRPALVVEVSRRVVGIGGVAFDRRASSSCAHCTVLTCSAVANPPILPPRTNTFLTLSPP